MALEWHPHNIAKTHAHYLQDDTQVYQKPKNKSPKCSKFKAKCIKFIHYQNIPRYIVKYFSESLPFIISH